MKYPAIITTLSLLFLNGTCDRQNDLTVYKDSTVVEFFRRTSGWVAGDGAFSVPLSDGSTLWLMGDSHIDDYDEETGTIPCLFQVNNAGLLQPENDWKQEHTQTLVSEKPGIRGFFRDSPESEHWFWPISGIQLEDTVYVYHQGVKHAKEEPLGFALTGQDMLAKITFPEMKMAGYYALQDFDGINFGVGFIKDPKSDYVYAFGHTFDLETKLNDLYLARFPENNPGATWECWDGAGWSTKATDAVPIKEDCGFTPMVCKVKDKYVLISSEFSIGCDQGNEIYGATSDKATGPFSQRKTLYTLDDTVQGHYPFFYVPVAHPQFINEKEEILITYNVNGYGDCVEGCVDNRMNPDHYRPRGIRVPLKLIDPKF